jgi:cell division protein FtsZ
MILFEEQDQDQQGELPIRLEEQTNMAPAKIHVVGIGGGGGNAVNRMIDAELKGIEFVAANTDLQALRKCRAETKLQLGAARTRGLGAGGDPSVGRESALEDTEAILRLLEGSDMVFLTAGLGGGTGTGAMPIIASLAAEIGALTVAVVTRPFSFEGRRRGELAMQGLDELRGAVDTVISIPNERLLSFVDRGTPLSEAFRIADDVLRQAVQGISDLITVPGEVNVDFADVKTIMTGMGMDLLAVAGGHLDRRRQGRADQHLRWPGPDSSRGRRGGPGGFGSRRRRRQHHLGHGHRGGSRGRDEGNGDRHRLQPARGEHPCAAADATGAAADQPVDRRAAG